MLFQCSFGIVSCSLTKESLLHYPCKASSDIPIGWVGHSYFTIITMCEVIKATEAIIARQYAQLLIAQTIWGGYVNMGSVPESPFSARFYIGMQHYFGITLKACNRAADF